MGSQGEILEFTQWFPQQIPQIHSKILIKSAHTYNFSQRKVDSALNLEYFVSFVEIWILGKGPSSAIIEKPVGWSSNQNYIH